MRPRRYFVYCLIFFQIISTPFSLSQEVDENDGFRSSVIHAPLIVRDGNSDILNAQYDVNVYQNRDFYHSARPAHSFELSILEDGTSDITLNDVYETDGKKDIYDNALGDAFFRMVGFAASSLYIATLGEDVVVRNLHYNLLVGFKGATEPLPSVDSCGVHSETACLQWAQANNLPSDSYYFNEVSLCAAGYGIGNLAEVQRARDGYESKMIKWTRIPLGKFDVVSQPGRINYFMTYYAKARFEVHLMAEDANNCVDKTPNVEYIDCPAETAYPFTPCVFESEVTICLVKFVGNADNSKHACSYYQNVLLLREANVPSTAPFPFIESNNHRVLNSDTNALFRSEDLTHLLPSAVSSLRSCYLHFGATCEYRDGGWSELIFTGCETGFTAVTENGEAKCVNLRNCNGVGSAVVPSYIPQYELYETVFYVDPETYKSYYDTKNEIFVDKGGPFVVTFVNNGGSCSITCKKIPDGDGSTYYTHLPTNEALNVAENLCKSSNNFGEVFYPSVDRKPLTDCTATLVEPTPFTDAVCMCPVGYKFREELVDGVIQLDVTSCVECDRCEVGKIAQIQCGTAWRYYLRRTRDAIMLWPQVDANSEYSVNPNVNAIDRSFTYFNIDQVCGTCDYCQGYVWTDCSGLTRACRPCNCGGNVANDEICIIDDTCLNTYSDNSVAQSLSTLQCDRGQWRDISVWVDGDDRSHTTTRWKELRCVECALISDEIRSMFDFSTSPSVSQIRCAIKVNDGVFTTGKAVPSCTGSESSLPSCVDCPLLPPYAFWLYISTGNQSGIEDCAFGCVEHYEKKWDGEKYFCAPCYQTVNNAIEATNACPTGEYKSSCGPNVISTCKKCTPRSKSAPPGPCSMGEYISLCANGYEIDLPMASSGMVNQCVLCNDDVECDSDKQYHRCTGYEFIDRPDDRCTICTDQTLPDNSRLLEGSCVGYCLPYFYHHVNPDDSWTCEPCPQTPHGIQHYCCGDNYEGDCGKTLLVSGECVKSGEAREPIRTWAPTCVCKSGWKPTGDGDCELCKDWKVSTDGTECTNCPQGGTQGNREIGADECEECPQSYYRREGDSSNKCLACQSGTDGRTGAVNCPMGRDVCTDGKMVIYDNSGNLNGCDTCGDRGFWTGTYDIFGITAD